MKVTEALFLRKLPSLLLVLVKTSRLRRKELQTDLNPLRELPS
jgi:hypothetical protein